MKCVLSKSNLIPLNTAMVSFVTEAFKSHTELLSYRGIYICILTSYLYIFTKPFFFKGIKKISRWLFSHHSLDTEKYVASRFITKLQLSFYKKYDGMTQQFSSKELGHKV